MNRSKKIIYLTLSAIFLTLSALGIGWLVKQEIEKGKQENQKQSSSVPSSSTAEKRKFPNNNAAPTLKLLSGAKTRRKKLSSDVESLMDSAEESDLEENQIDAR